MRFEPGFYAGYSVSPFTQSVLYSTRITTTSASPVVNFAATTVGTASTDRLVVVAAFNRGGTSFASVTINSSPATKISDCHFSNAVLGLYQMPLPTSETAVDIGFTMATTVSQKSAIAVWTLKGLTSQTPSTFGATTTQTSSVQTVSLNRPEGGVGVAASWNLNETPSSWSLGFTGVFDSTVGLAADGIAGGKLDPASVSTVSARVTRGTSNGNSLIAAIWA